MNGDLISRSALLERYGEPCHSFFDVIESMPTIDAVPVIRCKYCKYLTRSPWNRPDMGWCKLYGHNRRMDYYCASGEREGG